MSPVRVIVAVALAAALAVAAWLVLRQGAGGPGSGGGGAVLLFDPARVAELSVHRPGPRVEAVRRGALPGEWVVVLGGGDPPETVWPANGANVRAALRILSNVAPVRAAGADASPTPDAALVRVTLDDGSVRAMRLEGTVIAGAALAQPDPGGAEAGPPAWVDGALADMLVRAGPREWRDGAALGPIGAEVSRVTLRGASGTVSLARVQGRWALREPVQAPADNEAISRLVTALASVRVIDFLDAGPPEGTGLEAPAATLVLETDRRDPETGASQTEQTALRIGHQADIGGRGVFAALTRPGIAERVLVVSAEPLAGLTTDPAAYVSRRTLAVPAGDVASIQIGERRYTRTLDGWTAADREGAPAIPVTTEASQTIAAFLALLSDAPAERVALAGADSSAVAEGAVPVELGSLAGESIARLVISPLFAVENGAVVRTYSAAQAGDLFRWVGGD